MKRLLLFSAALILCTTLMAQAPQGISHQAVIRNTQGELVIGQTIGIRVSILQGSAEGTAVFVETHQPVILENDIKIPVASRKRDKLVEMLVSITKQK